MSVSCGTLYGIGVGPGDPDLLTLKAVAVLRSVSVILAASSSRNEYSVALDIAGPHLPPSTRVERLGFPMTRDPQTLRAAWLANAQRVADLLDSGETAAFLTLGDPMVYSTFGYLYRTLAHLRPDLPVQVIPGITSFQEAAARTGTILCEAGENLLLAPGINSREELRRDMAVADNLVIVKAYRNFGLIREEMQASGRAETAIFCSRVGLEGEELAHGLGHVEDTPPYLSLILSTREREEK